MDHEDGLWIGVGKIILAWAVYVGSITLGDWQIIVGIIGGLMVIIFTALQTYVLWRDKVVKHRAKGTRTRLTDSTGPAQL